MTGQNPKAVSNFRSKGVPRGVGGVGLAALYILVFYFKRKKILVSLNLIDQAGLPAMLNHEASHQAAGAGVQLMPPGSRNTWS